MHFELCYFLGFSFVSCITELGTVLTTSLFFPSHPNHSQQTNWPLLIRFSPREFLVNPSQGISACFACALAPETVGIGIEGQEEALRKETDRRLQYAEPPRSQHCPRKRISVQKFTVSLIVAVDFLNTFWSNLYQHHISRTFF